MAVTQNKTIILPSGIKILYRERSQIPNAPIILLLHGFPSSSHQYRNLIPLLGTKYRVIAPDLPGFGFTETPSTYKYTFDNLAATMTEFLDELSITKYSIYIFDYGAQQAFASPSNAHLRFKP
jgi:Predicted hydrolases or acyltransferases (alpha/beta hydrolase superfamily)